MLSAQRKSDGQTAYAYFESSSNAPFVCSACNAEVILRTNANQANYFTHASPFGCQYGEGESAEHRYCKMEIFRALLQESGVTDVMLERPLGTNRPDVSFYINNVPVAIEVQISSLSLETITARTVEYARKGIYVLWLLPWTPELNGDRYAPKLWEKWLHTCYFGRVYYWLENLTVLSYGFEPSLKAVPKTSWHFKNGEKRNTGGYSRRSKRFRSTVRRGNFHLVKDFAPRERCSWNGNSIAVPNAKLFMEHSV